MNWNHIRSDQDLVDIIKSSYTNERGVAIFKHSTRCSISSVALSRLESSWDNAMELPTYFLDLIQYRALSNHIATEFNVTHESPQLLIIKNGECIYHSSHLGISVKKLKSVLEIKA